MESLVVYILKSCLASGIFFLYYLLALKNKKFHSYNRFYLLLAIVVSVTAPLIPFNWIAIDLFHDTSATTGPYSAITQAGQIQPESLFTPGRIFLALGSLISLSLLAALLFNIRWIFRIKSQNRKTKMKGYTFIETDVKQAPFSFFNDLFWKNGLSVTDPNGQKILKHELTHIAQKHTYDRLLTQTVVSVFWINPFYWLIHKELCTIHEFMADSESVSDGDTESFAEMLLYSHNEGNYLLPSHPFFNSSIKRRLIMISSSKKTRNPVLSRILALPVILVVLAALSIHARSQTIIDVKPASVDTIPKVSLEPVTVQGKPIQAQQAKPSAPAASLKPVTVQGQPLKKTTAYPAKTGEQVPTLKAVTAEGQPTQVEITTVLTLEPVTVQGQPLQKGEQVVLTAPVVSVEPIKAGVETKISTPVISLEPVTVQGHPKAGGKVTTLTLTPVNVEGQPKPAQKATTLTLEPVTVQGYKKEVKVKPAVKE